MSYELKLRRSAQKDLDDLPEKDYRTVANAISGLQDNPRPTKVKKLGASGLWRIRVGRHRVVYSINDASRTVTIVRVARRQENTYKGL